MSALEEARNQIKGLKRRNSIQPKSKSPELKAKVMRTRTESDAIRVLPVGPAVRTELPLQLLEVERPPISATDNNPALKECVAACILGLSDETLKKWRQRGIGPNYIQYGPDGVVSYLLSDLMEFRANHTIKTRPMPKTIEVRKASKTKHRMEN